MFGKAVANRLKEYGWPDGRGEQTRIWNGAK